MKISTAFLLQYHPDDISILKLAFDNQQLNLLGELVKEPSSSRLVDFDSLNGEEFKSPSRYFINIKSDNTERSYGEGVIEIFDEIFDKLSDDISYLENSTSIFNSDGKIAYPLVMYQYKTSDESVKTQDVYIYPLTKSLTVTNKIGFFGNHQKAGSSNVNKLKAQEVKDGFYLPVSGCVCSFHKKEIIASGSSDVIKTINVYKAFDFAKMFNIREIQYKYAKNTINRFNKENDPLTLTRDNIKVKFPIKDKKIDQTIFDKVNSNENLISSFAHFKGTKRSIIQSIDKKQLDIVLTRMKKYAEENATADFSFLDLPQLIDDGKSLSVNSRQVPIFACLFENKVIERLLNGRIEVSLLKNHVVKDDKVE